MRKFTEAIRLTMKKRARSPLIRMDGTGLGGGERGNRCPGVGGGNGGGSMDQSALLPFWAVFIN